MQVKRVGNDAGKRGRRTPMKQSRHERKAAQQARARQLEDQEYAEEEEEVVVEDDGDAPPLYCHCKRPDFGEMIACDNDSCTIEWCVWWFAGIVVVVVVVVVPAAPVDALCVCFVGQVPFGLRRPDAIHTACRPRGVVLPRVPACARTRARRQGQRQGWVKEAARRWRWRQGQAGQVLNLTPAEQAEQTKKNT